MVEAEIRVPWSHIITITPKDDLLFVRKTRNPQEKKEIDPMKKASETVKPKTVC